MLEEGTRNEQTRDPDEAPPPILGTWRRLYTSVLVFLVLIVVLLMLFTLHYEGSLS